MDPGATADPGHFELAGAHQLPARGGPDAQYLPGFVRAPKQPWEVLLVSHSPIPRSGLGLREPVASAIGQGVLAACSPVASQLPLTLPRLPPSFAAPLRQPPARAAARCRTESGGQGVASTTVGTTTGRRGAHWDDHFGARSDLVRPVATGGDCWKLDLQNRWGARSSRPRRDRSPRLPHFKKMGIMSAAAPWTHAGAQPPGGLWSNALPGPSRRGAGGAPYRGCRPPSGASRLPRASGCRGWPPDGPLPQEECRCGVPESRGA